MSTVVSCQYGIIITITTTSTLVITLCRVTDSRLPPSGLELIDNVGLYKFSLMEISDHADTQGVHLFSDSDHDYFIDWEDDDILGRLLRVPGGCVCGKWKLPLSSGPVWYSIPVLRPTTNFHLICLHQMAQQSIQYKQRPTAAG